jgi:hypothetical protein
MLEDNKHQHKTHITGQNAHDAALADLKARGYIILDQKKTLKDIKIEIDIIASKNDIIEFVEVKGGKRKVDQIKRGLFNALVFSESHYNDDKTHFILYTESVWPVGSSGWYHIRDWINAGRLHEHRTLTVQSNTTLDQFAA